MISHTIKYELRKDPFVTIINQFGEIEINLENQIIFPHGMIGMPDCKHSCLANINVEKFKYFKLLQGVVDTKLSFLTLPILIHNKFIDSSDLEKACSVLGIKVEDVAILLIASTKITDQGKKIIVNARAPIFIDSTAKTAIQYVIPETKYNIQHIID